jgi:hypothetical protein
MVAFSRGKNFQWPRSGLKSLSDIRGVDETEIVFSQNIRHSELLIYKI